MKDKKRKRMAPPRSRPEWSPHEQDPKPFRPAECPACLGPVGRNVNRSRKLYAIAQPDEDPEQRRVRAFHVCMECERKLCTCSHCRSYDQSAIMREPPGKPSLPAKACVREPQPIRKRFEDRCIEGFQQMHLFTRRALMARLGEDCGARLFSRLFANLDALPPIESVESPFETKVTDIGKLKVRGYVELKFNGAREDEHYRGLATRHRDHLTLRIMTAGASRWVRTYSGFQVPPSGMKQSRTGREVFDLRGDGDEQKAIVWLLPNGTIAGVFDDPEADGSILFVPGDVMPKESIQPETPEQPEAPKQPDTRRLLENLIELFLSSVGIKEKVPIDIREPDADARECGWEHAIPCLPLSAALGKPPADIADLIARRLRLNKLVKRATSEGGVVLIAMDEEETS